MLDHPFNSNPHQGIVNALFEKDGNEYYPINTKDFQCSTEQVFIMNGYEDIESKYENSLFELRVQLSNREVKDGACNYISTSDYSSPLKTKLACAQIFDAPVPDSNKMSLTVYSLPKATTIFLKENDMLHGPFSLESYDIKNSEQGIFEIKLATLTQEIRSNDNQKLLQAYHYAKVHQALVQQSFFEVKEQHNSLTFIGDIRTILNHSEDFVDHISDSEIVNKYGGLIASNPQIRGFSKAQRDLIRKQVNDIRQYNQYKPRFQRLFELFDYTDEWGSARATLMESFISSDKGTNVLKEYIEANKEDYFKEERVRFEESLKNESVELKEDIKQLESQKHSLETAIRSKTEQLKNTEIQDDESDQVLANKLKDNIDASVNESKHKLEEINKKLEEIKSQYSTYKKLAEVEDEIKGKEAVKKHIDKSIEQLSEQKNKIQVEIKDGNSTLLSRLVELKPQVDMLSGVMPTEPKNKVIFDTPVNYNVPKYDTEQQQRFIEQLSDTLASYGRKIDFDDLANIVITMSQSQFTLFSGLPGTGKTSLAKLIGKSIGLDNRLLNIPVARGWTSQRDVLGFYNALSQNFVTSATGLYDMLSQMQNSDDGLKNSPSIVLLDEFNLSQPEHYFSPFMEMADNESERIIHTGDPATPQLYVPQHVRFLGTINHDESVQILTPRMLDRSSIIHFDELIDGASLSSLDNSKNSVEKPTISGNDFIKLFNPTGVNELPEEIYNILNSIMNILHNDEAKFGNQVIVSYRKVKAITNYYNTASSLMISERLTALDYAICQHIIPLLNGFGEGFGLRLSELLSQLPDGLVKTRAKLQRIINRGQLNLHTYGALS